MLRKMCGLVCFVYLCAYPSGLVCCRLLVVPVVIVGDFKFHVRRQCLLITSVNFRTTGKNDLPPAHAHPISNSIGNTVVTIQQVLHHVMIDTVGESDTPSQVQE